MPNVSELTALYGNFMLGPRAGPGVCRTCFNLTDGYERCYACSHKPSILSAVVPISYSVGGEQLHHALAGYKRSSGDAARRLALGIGAVIWRFLLQHEQCVAHAAGVESFPIVCTVPSSGQVNDRRHPMCGIVADIVGPTRDRHLNILRRSRIVVAPRQFSAEKFDVLRPFDGEPVLLIDDTWTTGANAQSAAAALRAAGSGPVAAVVVGRHVNRGWHQTDARLRSLPHPFQWEQCALCAAAGAAAAA